MKMAKLFTKMPGYLLADIKHLVRYIIPQDLKLELINKLHFNLIIKNEINGSYRRNIK